MAQHEQLFCSLDTDGGPGMGGHREGEQSMGGHGIQSFHPATEADGVATTQTFKADDGRVHFNLLGWNGEGAAPNLFPEAGTS